MIKILEVEKNPETNQMESLLKTFVLIVIHKARSSLYCIYFYNIGYNPVGERRCSCHQIYKRCEGQFVKYHRFPPRRVILFFCQVLNQYRVSTQAVQFLTREFIFFLSGNILWLLFPVLQWNTKFYGSLCFPSTWNIRKWAE